MHHLVAQYAQDNHQQDRDSSEFLDLLEQDRKSGLNIESTKRLKALRRDISYKLSSATKIVASTLNNCHQDVLRIGPAFAPDFLVCDGSGQCLEGDHMISLTMGILKGVILLSDPA